MSEPAEAHAPPALERQGPPSWLLYLASVAGAVLLAAAVTYLLNKLGI